MHVSSIRAFRVAALLGFLAVALGAFGAHGLENVFTSQPKAREWWEKAVFYHAVHATVLLLLACLRTLPVVVWSLFAAGILFFSGSLYVAAAGGPHWLVHVTPLGGLCLLAGWFWLAVRPPIATTGREGTSR